MIDSVEIDEKIPLEIHNYPTEKGGGSVINLIGTTLPGTVLLFQIIFFFLFIRLFRRMGDEDTWLSKRRLVGVGVTAILPIFLIVLHLYCYDIPESLVTTHYPSLLFLLLVATGGLGVMVGLGFGNKK
jgi:hypothetical protein